MYDFSACKALLLTFMVFLIVFKPYSELAFHKFITLTNKQKHAIHYS